MQPLVSFTSPSLLLSPLLLSPLPLSSLLLSLCCVYLAFKVEEYNVSVDQFVHVLAPQLRAFTAELVLSHEV